MDLEGLYKSRIEMLNAVSTKRIELRELELNLESIELEIEEREHNDG